MYDGGKGAEVDEKKPKSCETRKDRIMNHDPCNDRKAEVARVVTLVLVLPWLSNQVIWGEV